jgi:hypothetical protein
MLLLAWPIVLFLLVVFHFRWRFNAEFDRQQQITWPAVPAVFSTEKLELTKALPGGESMPYNTSLTQHYAFYSQGARHVGNQLLPELLALDEGSHAALVKQLNDQKSTLQVRYDPTRPVQNFLAVGHGGLSWPKVCIYAFFGVVLPMLLIYSTLALLTDPAAWWDAITFGESLGTQIN